jgi:predicted O-linked N-acetylglucosamine transferase (SPINDLY family)
VIAKASDSSALVETRRGLRDRMRQSPLLDHAGFTRNLERAFLRMYDFARRSGRGESIPRVIDIAESDL